MGRQHDNPDATHLACPGAKPSNANLAGPDRQMLPRPAGRTGVAMSNLDECKHPEQTLEQIVADGVVMRCDACAARLKHARRRPTADDVAERWREHRRDWGLTWEPNRFARHYPDLHS